MSNVALSFEKAGMLTLVQDMGRTGYQRFGVPVGGALDRASALVVNQLVGNSRDSPVLEITLTGPTIRFSGACQIALTGGDLQPSVNGARVTLNTSLDIKAGDILSFGHALSGCRTYLAVRGDWQVPEWLQSTSANLQTEVPVTPQSIIAKGDELIVVTRDWIARRYVEPPSLLVEGICRVRSVPGPEWQLFSQEQRDYLIEQAFTVSNNANRMGYRFQERLPDYRPGSQMISSGIIPGTMQITNEGQPVVLLADGQTIGGYPRIANVISSDLDKFGQLKPGDSVRFEMITWPEASEEVSRYLEGKSS